MNSGPQRTAIAKPDAAMIATISLRLGDHVSWAPNAVVDQSLLAIRPAISFFVERDGGRLAPLSSSDILVPVFGSGGKQPKPRNHTTVLKSRSRNKSVWNLARLQVLPDAVGS